MIRLNVNNDEESSTGLWVYNISNGEFKIDPVLKEIFKTKKSTFKSLAQVLQFCHPDFRDFVSSRLLFVIDQHQSVVFDFIITDGEHKESWVRTTASPNEITDGPVRLIVGVARDITKEVNDDLRNKTLLSALDKLAIISTAGTNGKIGHVNEGFLKTSGFQYQELKGQDHRIISSGLHSNLFYKKMWTQLFKGREFHSEFTNKNKNGELVWVESHIFPIKNFKGEIKEFISLSFDITEKKKMQKNELIMAKFHAVGETSAQIMHDVMNPISIIQANIKILQKKTDSDQQIESEYLLKKLDSMNEASLRIVKIFKNMKDLLNNKVETEASEMTSTIVKAIDVLELKLSKVNVSIDTSKIKDDHTLVKMNGQQLLQVLINLISNACDAIENHSERWIDFELKHHQHYAVLSIRDSGPGIPPKIRDKIFDSLFTTKGSEKGTGLGLSVCKRIMEKNEGQIVLNTEGPHTQFDIYFVEIRPNSEKQAA